MKRVIALVSFLIAVIILLVYFYFKNTFSLQNSSKGITAVPEHAALVLQFENNREFYELYGDNPLFRTLLGDAYIDELSFLKTLFIDNPLIREQLGGKDICASVHRTRSDALDVLFIVSIDKRRSFKKPEELLREFITPKNTVRTRQFENTALHEFIFSESGKVLAFAIKNHLLLISYSPTLVEESIRQLASGKVAIAEEALRTVQVTPANRSMARLYINYQRLNEFILALAQPSIARLASQLQNFAGWSALDFNFKSDAFMLSGYTFLPDSGKYLSLFQNQRPQKHELIEVLPASTAAFIDFSLSNYRQFRSDMRTYLKRKNKLRLTELQWSELEYKYGFSLEDAIGAWAGNEFGIAIGDNNGLEAEKEWIHVVKVGDKEGCLAFFRKLNGNDTSAIRDNYKNFSVGYNPVPELFSLMYGDVFATAKSNYYGLVQEYLVMAEDPATVHAVIDNYLSLQTLTHNESYASFESFISNECNVYAYANTVSSYRMINFFANGKFRERLEKEQTGLKHFSGLAYQLSSDGEHFFTSIYWPLQAKEKKENNIAWKFELDAPPAIKPAVVFNHQTNEKELLVQDEQNMLYLLSRTGKLIWKVPVKGRIISAISQVDYFRNNKLQYIFNTKTHIYVLDRNGRPLPPYPLKLAAPATCGMALFDYEKTKAYRIFISCENQAVYGYSLDGKLLEGWNPKADIGILLHPVQHVQLEGKDYLFMYNTKGDIYFFNRKGQPLIRHLEDRITLYRNPFVLDTVTPSVKPRFISTDTTGTIRSIFFDGTKLYKHLGSWTNTHFFDYKNIAGDKRNEYIFLDKNGLFVYGPDTVLLFNYEFLYDISQRPQFFLRSDRKYLIGISSDKTDQAFLFREDGTLYKGFPLKGGTLFEITDLRDDNVQNLIVGSSDRNIYVYEME